MTARAKLVDGWLVWVCPGCYTTHRVPVEPDAPRFHEKPPGWKPWDWTGGLEAPTLNPSVLVTCPGLPSEEIPPLRCHSWVRDGRAEFLPDSSHVAAGATLELPPFPDDPTA